MSQKYKFGFLKKDGAETIKPLLTNYKFFKEYLGLDKNKILDFALHEIRDIIDSKTGFVIIAEENEKAVGLVSFKKLGWDTEHFGIEIAKIEHIISDEKDPEIRSGLLRYLFEICKDKKISLLSCRVSGGDIQNVNALESNGFMLMDNVVVLSLDMKNYRAGEIHNCIRDAKETDLDGLKKIAKISFPYSRFQIDRNLPIEKGRDVYVKWLENSCKPNSKKITPWEEDFVKGYNEKIFVAEMNKKPAGFITFKIHESFSKFIGIRFGSIELIAVSPEFQGMGIGKDLVNSALNWFADKVDTVEVSSWINQYPALKMYQNSGFRLVSSLLSFHRWFDGN